MLARVILLSLLAAVTAQAGEYVNTASEAAHTLAMMKLQESAYADLHAKFKPLVKTDEEWDRLVSVILETWHVAYFTATGTVDNRESDDQMPWKSPGMICDKAM